jgi:hypothetical protein
MVKNTIDIDNFKKVVKEYNGNQLAFVLKKLLFEQVIPKILFKIKDKFT